MSKPKFKIGDKVSIDKNIQWIQRSKSKSFIGTIKRLVTDYYSGDISFYWVLREGMKQCNSIHEHQLTLIDKQPPNIFADWLEENGELLAASKLRNAFPLEE